MTAAQLADRRVLLIGLGDLGARIARDLRAAGAAVTGVRRGPDAPEGVTLVRGDARDPAVLATLPDDFDAAVICVTPAARDEAGYRDGYLAVARAVAERYGGAPLQRVLWISSTAVHGQDGGAEVDDDAPTEPGSFRGRVLLEAEGALAAALPTTSLRLSGIYGPGRLALLRRVFDGRGAPESPPQWTNRIHADDAAAIVTFLLGRALGGDTLPDALLVTDPTPTPRHVVLGWLAEQLDVTLEVPLPAAVDAGPNRRLLPRRLLDLGYRFIHPDYRSGFGALLDTMKRSGELDALRRTVAGEGP